MLRHYPPIADPRTHERGICIFPWLGIRLTKQRQFERMGTDARGKIDPHSNSRDPVVTIVVPCFNAARTLSRAIASARNQTYRRLDIIVVDDVSTDSSAAIAADFAASDHRVRLFKQPNSGVAAARNLGIANAVGEFMAPLDGDVLWPPQKC